MIFVNLETGNTFTPSKDWVFWLENSQSVNIYYAMKLAVISKKQFINCEMDSKIFSFANPSASAKELKDIIINNKTFQSSGTKLSPNEFLHITYVIAMSPVVGECTTEIIIDNEAFKVGGDFYGCNEEDLINLKNLETHIPTGIQKAIYDGDVNEDKTDYILYNRKIKELLTNSLTILGNKGSYKSMINALEWFEWGDKIELREFWKTKFKSFIHFSMNEINDVIDADMKTLLNQSTKTTFIGLYAQLNGIAKKGDRIQYEKINMSSGDSRDLKFSLEHAEVNGDLNINNKILSIQDDHVIIEENTKDLPGGLSGANFEKISYEDPAFLAELNPQIYNISYDINKVDISLKISLLGSYLSRFLPIHITPIHYTMENVVFQVPQKLFVGSLESRKDYFDNIFPLSITSPKKEYYLKTEHVYVYEDTLFKSLNGIVGCEDELRDIVGDKNQELFARNLYFDIACKIPLEIDLNFLEDDEYIFKEELTISGLDDLVKSNNIYYKNNKINFNILLQEVGSYNIKINLTSIRGINYIGDININVRDDSDSDIKLFKVSRMSLNDRIILNNLPSSDGLNNFTFSNISNNSGYHKYVQYLPTSKIGMGVSHVVHIGFETESEKSNIKKNYNYIWLERNTKTAKYMVGISKKFIDEMTNERYKYSKVIYNTTEFFENEMILACMHELKEYDNRDIKIGEVLCVSPTVLISKEISESTWIFKNDSTGEYWEEDGLNIQEPFIADFKLSQNLTPGYYTIIFKYKLGETTNTKEFSSCFKINYI